MTKQKKVEKNWANIAQFEQAHKIIEETNPHLLRNVPKYEEVLNQYGFDTSYKKLHDWFEFLDAKPIDYTKYEIK